MRKALIRLIACMFVSGHVVVKREKPKVAAGATFLAVRVCVCVGEIWGVIATATVCGSASCVFA